MQRRDFMGAMGAGLLTGPSAMHAAAGATKPNIFIVIADDQTFRDVGCYGSPNARTPRIDRLAANGMRFTQAFTATAMCAPTRSQLYTGLYPVRSGAYPNHSGVYPQVKSLPHYLGALGYRVALAGKRHIKPAANFPFDYLGGTAAAIEAWIDKAPAQPFCVILASHHPHGPYPKGSPYDPAEIVLPPYLADTPETRQAMADYFYEITQLDAEVGDCLDLVERRRLRDSTLFIYTTEQGSGFPFAKWTCYDAGLKVGLIARWPGVVKPGSVTDAMVHYIDVVPTLVEAAGGTPPADIDGRSFLHVLQGTATEHRDVVFGAHTTRGIINGTDCYPIRSIRTRSHKFIMNLNAAATFTNAATRGAVWESWVRTAATDPTAAALVKRYQHRPAEELYDLRRDPDELHNLAARPENAELVASLKAKLTAWMAAQGDTGIATEMKAFERQGRKPHRAASGKPDNGGTDQRRYVLEQNAVLENDAVPRVGGHGLHIEAVIESTSPDGIILAQGAKAYGYALLVRDGKLMLAVSEQHKVSVCAAPEPLPAGKVTVSARLARSGAMSLAVNGTQVAVGKAPGPLSQTPKDGLQVGRDLGNAVLSDYEPPYAFRGTVHRVVLTLED